MTRQYSNILLKNKGFIVYFIYLYKQRPKYIYKIYTVFTLKLL